MISSLVSMFLVITASKVVSKRLQIKMDFCYLTWYIVSRNELLAGSNKVFDQLLKPIVTLIE